MSVCAIPNELLSLHMSGYHICNNEDTNYMCAMAISSDKLMAKLEQKYEICVA